MGLFDSGGLFGGGGSTGFSGGGIGSSANQTANNTENLNNAVQEGNLYSTRDGSITVTDGGIAALAFDFVGKANADAVASTQALTSQLIEKQTLDSGQRIQQILYAVAAVAALIGGIYVYKRA